ncbi:MAG TPA: low-complexity tail membrane protein [Coleofasciculaceae cyanobacterium]
MRSFWSDPYLWIHLAGLATLPLLLELCLLGLAMGVPILPPWLEFGIVAAIGVGPVLWMQLQRPFFIFSLVAVALNPSALTDDQRRLLTLFKSQRNQILAVVTSLLSLSVLTKLYSIAPIAADRVPFLSDSRLLGLLLASIAFLLANLFIQVPVSVLGVLSHSDEVFARIPPYLGEEISRDFSLLGLWVNKILPPLSSPLTPAVNSVAAMATPTVNLVTPAAELEKFVNEATIEPGAKTAFSEAQSGEAQSAAGLPETTETDPWLE